MLGALKRKPSAFARWVLRDAAFPRAIYRQSWERYTSQKSEREACKTMVVLLVLRKLPTLPSYDELFEMAP